MCALLDYIIMCVGYSLFWLYAVAVLCILCWSGEIIMSMDHLFYWLDNITDAHFIYWFTVQFEWIVHALFIELHRISQFCYVDFDQILMAVCTVSTNWHFYYASLIGTIYIFCTYHTIIKINCLYIILFEVIYQMIASNVMLCMI